ncbi:MAG: permease [Candidatus Njordarchaeia archaeon]|nr:permease [Candidatus Korarchaeota archaeon]
MDKMEIVGVLIFVLIVLGSYVLLYITLPNMVSIAIEVSIQNFMDVFLIFIFAALLASLADLYIDKELILKVFDPNRNSIYNYAIATAIGIITPGPVYSIFPIVLVLRKKGATEDILISYLTAQTLMGPIRVPLEIVFLGVEFLVFRTIVTVIIGILAGVLTKPLVGWIRAEEL